MPELRLDLRPLTLADILDRSFRLYRDNFVSFLGAAAVVVVPEALIVVLLTPASKDFGRAAGPQLWEALQRLSLLVPLSLLATAFAQAALAVMIAERVLGRRMGVLEAYRQALRRMPSLVGAGIGAALLIGFGSLLLVVPGVYVLLGLALVPTVLMIERVGAVEGLRRSWRLARGDRGRIFVLMFLTFLVDLAVTQALSFLLGLGTQSEAAKSVASQVASMLVMPVVQGSYVLVYFDDRVRKEGFDLEILASQVGGRAAAGEP